MKRLLWIALIVLAIVSPVEASFTHVNHVASATINGVTAGNLLVVSIQWIPDASQTVSSLSGNGNTWVRATNTYATIDGTSGASGEIFYALSANSGNTTVSITWSGTTPTFFGTHIYEFSATGTIAFDAGNKEAVSGASFPTDTTLTITTANANEVLVSGLVNKGGFGTAPTGWATATGSSDAWNNYSSYLADAGSAGSKNAFWSSIDFGSYVQSLAAFTDGGGGGAAKPKTMTTMGVGRP